MSASTAALLDFA